MGWGHPGSPAQSPWGGRPCWSPPTCAAHGPAAPGQPLSITTCGTRPPPARRSEQICFPPMPREAPCACVTGCRHWWHWEEARSRAPPSPVTAAALGSSSPLRGVQGAPRARRQPGLLLSQPEQPLPHTRPRHKDALLFLRRAKTEPGQSHPFGSGAVPGGHQGPLGGGPGKLGMSPGCSPAPRCRVTISSKRPLGVPRCRRATGQQSLQGGRGTRSPPRPRGTGMGKPLGCWGKGSSGEGEQWGRALCLLPPAPTSPQLSVGAGGAELLCPRRTRPQPQPHLPRPPTGDVGMDPALGKAPRPSPNPRGVQEKGS